MSYIRCSNLTVAYEQSREPVLKNLNFTVPNNRDFILLAGENGSGKTTLLRVIRGLTKGISVDEDSVITLCDTSIHQNQSEIGLVFQQPSTQLLNLKVENEIQFGPLLTGKDWGDVVNSRQNILTELNIDNLQDRFSFRLSGGQEQKVAIGSILAMEPDLLLLDEPLSNLDPPTQSTVLMLLQELNSSGVPILVSSHETERFLAYVDFVIELTDGEVSYSGPPEEFSVKKQEYGPKDTVAETIPTSSIVNTSGLQVTYPNGEIGVKDVDITIPQGPITCIIGPNGTGKSSLARACVGFVKFSGELQVSGEDLSEIHKSDLAGKVGYVAQEPEEMFFKESVHGEIEASVENVLGENCEEKVREVIDRFDLSDIEDRPPSSLSKGQQRIVSIAVMYTVEPDLLFLDEPDRALDTSKKNLVSRVIQDLSGDTTVVILSHDMELCQYVGEYFILMGLDGEAGTVVTQGTIDSEPIQSVLSDPEEEFDELLR